MMPTVGRAAFALGFAGLLPQILAAACLGWMRYSGADDMAMGALLTPVLAVAMIYPALILSFIGGMWWSLAVRRDHGQGALAGIAVLPSLVALACFLSFALAEIGWTLVALGSALLLTLPVDRRLVATGEAPANWMTLRVPLSLGLGGLTIVTGALSGF